MSHPTTDLHLSANDQTVLRGLAIKLAEIAAKPVSADGLPYPLALQGIQIINGEGRKWNCRRVGQSQSGLTLDEHLIQFRHPQRREKACPLPTHTTTPARTITYSSFYRTQ